MTRSTAAADVVIVGGGAIGGAVAVHLLEDHAFTGRVTLIERDPTYRRASSALSAASIRQQFSTPENIRLSRASFAWRRDARHRRRARSRTEEAGYLYLATADGAHALEANHAVQVDEGADVVLLTPEALAARFPWMSVDGVALASLGRSGEGWFDGYALVQALRRRALDLGADLLTAEVSTLHVADERVVSIGFTDGTARSCGTVVDAAGPWAAEVAAMAGVVLPVEARRRSVFVFDARSGPPDCPLVIDTSGAWFRPEGGGFIAGISPDETGDLGRATARGRPRASSPTRLWPALAARVPAFDAIRLTGAWAGYYEVNTFDHNAIIGAHPRDPEPLFANGFSGHGIQQSPAVGRAIAELIVHGRYVTIDLSVFGFERIAAGRPVIERNVIG